jgi:hypothetical protein
MEQQEEAQSRQSGSRADYESLLSRHRLLVKEHGKERSVLQSEINTMQSRIDKRESRLRELEQKTLLTDRQQNIIEALLQGDVVATLDTDIPDDSTPGIPAENIHKVPVKFMYKFTFGGYKWRDIESCGYDGENAAANKEDIIQSYFPESIEIEGDIGLSIFVDEDDLSCAEPSVDHNQVELDLYKGCTTDRQKCTVFVYYYHLNTIR